MSGHCEDCKNNPCVCDAEPVDHVVDADEIVSRKKDVKDAISAMYQHEHHNHLLTTEDIRFISGLLAHTEARRVELEMALEAIVLHMKVVSPTGYAMSSAYAIAMCALEPANEKREKA